MLVNDVAWSHKINKHIYQEKVLKPVIRTSNSFDFLKENALAKII